jgi:hypothetical protein
MSQRRLPGEVTIPEPIGEIVGLAVLREDPVNRVGEGAHPSGVRSDRLHSPGVRCLIPSQTARSYA